MLLQLLAQSSSLCTRGCHGYAGPVTMAAPTVTDIIYILWVLGCVGRSQKKVCNKINIVLKKILERF